MSAGELRQDHAKFAEKESYRAYLALALLSTVVHAALLAYDWTLGGHQNLPTLILALSASVALAVMVRWRLVRLESLGQIVAYATPLWLLSDTARALLTKGTLPAQYFIITGIVVLLGFTWLPVRRAGFLTALVLLCTSALVIILTPQQIPLLLYVYFLCGLIAFLTQYGQRLNIERSRSDWLRQLAFVDPLTGAMNRRGGWEALEKVERHNAHAILLLDIDRFKSINDRLGHAAGDTVLVEVTRAIRQAVGPEALVARWGGEEFLVLLRADEEAAKAAAERVIHAVRALHIAGLDSISISGGLALAREAHNRDEWVDLADQRMYEAKQAGGDRWV